MIFDEEALIRDDIHQFLDRNQKKELLRFVTVGSVDDGKSTLIGRLLHDTKGVYDDQLKDATQTSETGERPLTLLELRMAFAQRENKVSPSMLHIDTSLLHKENSSLQILPDMFNTREIWPQELPLQT